MKPLIAILTIFVSTISFSVFADTAATTSLDSNATQSTMDAAVSDTAITTNVKTAFLKEKLFGTATMSAFSISVETKGGIVHLTGTADSQAQADNAVKIAKQVSGVKNVVSDVEIKMPATQ